MTQVKAMPRISEKIDDRIDRLITKQNESYSNWREARINENHDIIRRNAASYTQKKEK